MTRTLAHRSAGLLAAVALAATALVALAAPAGALPTGVVIVDTGLGCQIGAIDLGTGAVTNLTNLQDKACSDDLAYGPDGTLYGIFKGFLVTLDPATGTVTPVGDERIASFTDVGGLTFDASGRLWVTLLGNETPCINVNGAATAPPDSTPPAEDLVVPIEPEWCLYQINATGIGNFVAQLNQTPFNITNEVGLAGSCDGRVLGNYDRASPPAGVVNPLRLGSFNTTDGQITDIGPNGQHQILSIDFEPAAAGSPQTLWGVGLATRSVYTLNQSTGLATPTATITGVGDEDIVLALAIAPISCPAAVVAIQPTFTG